MTVQVPRTAALLLAAGQSRRHPGQSKLSRRLDDQPMGIHAARAIAALAPAVRIAVVSEATCDLAPALEDLGFETAWNDDPGRGLASSIAIGVRAALDHQVEAVLVCLADMPFVSAAHLRALLARVDGAGGVTMVGSRPAGSETIMPPAVFAGEAIGRLLELEGDRGAGALLRHGPAVEASPEELLDLDDPAAFDAVESARKT